jgi:hypothetical protein
MQTLVLPPNQDFLIEFGMADLSCSLLSMLAYIFVVPIILEI